MYDTETKYEFEEVVKFASSHEEENVVHDTVHNAGVAMSEIAADEGNEGPIYGNIAHVTGATNENKYIAK